MTVIDKISLRLRMADEQFAKELYADWDDFCRNSVTDIMDEFFARYETKDAYIEISRLDLDLGNIPQEEFYGLFPVRLREALERCFTRTMSETGYANTGLQETESMTVNTVTYVGEKRFENLLHYLVYGFCLPQWGTDGFDLYEELSHFRDTEYTERLLAAAVSNPHVLERLILQTDTARLTEVIPFAVWLETKALGQYEKQRFLSVVLELAPQALIRFIHEANESGSVEDMAELLENPHIRHIMQAETENHAEIDVPEYWYRLYGWLLEYYPFNGVPMFGDKRHFRLHLGRRLLTFIRKREQQAYLSKADLTARFLLEVFGADYYLAVINIIYHNQRLNADGSPSTGDSYVWELYYMLLQLSLIGTKREPAGNPGEQQNETSGGNTPEDNVSVISSQPDSFGEWLENTDQSVQSKRILLRKLVQDKPELLIQWVKNRLGKKYLSLLAAMTDKLILLQLARHISLQLAEVLSIMSDTLGRVSMSVSWLNNVAETRLTEALNAAVWQGISTGSFSASDSGSSLVVRIAGLLYEEITGEKALTATDTGTSCNISKSIDISVENGITPMPVQELLDSIAVDFHPAVGQNSPQDIQYRTSNSYKNASVMEQTVFLKTVLSDTDIPKTAKRILLLQWFDVYKNRERELVSLLQSEALLEVAVSLLDDATLRYIARRLAVKDKVTDAPAVKATAIPLVGLIIGHMETIANILSRPTERIWYSLLVALVSERDNSCSVSGNSNMEYIIRLLSTIADNKTDKILAVVESLTEMLPFPNIATSDNENHRGLHEEKLFPIMDDNALLVQLVQAQRHIGSFLPVTTSVLNEIQTAFEQHLNNMTELSSWLRNETFSSMQKRAVFLRYMADSPTEAARLIRKTINSDESTVELWSEILGKDSILYLLAKTDPMLANVLTNAIHAIHSASVWRNVFTDGSAKQDESVAKAILLFMAENPNMESVNAEEIVTRFLHRLHESIAGNKEYTDADRSQWKAMERRVIGAVVSEMPKADAESITETASETTVPSLENMTDVRERKLFDKWIAWFLSPSVSDTEKSRMLRHYARWQSKLLWRFVRYSTTGGAQGRNIPSERWNGWLGTSDWLEMLSGVSLSLGETLHRAVKAVAGRYGISDTVLSEGLVRFISVHPADRIYHGNTSAVVREYLEFVSTLAWKDGIPDAIREQFTTTTGDNKSEQAETEKILHPDERETALEIVVRAVETELNIADTEQILEDALRPEYIEVPNAGLCLLTLWLPRLFGMLGLLAEDKKTLKDTEARIRAIFILQLIVTEEVREYKEQELAFNRILTGCPFHVPLPKTLKLTENEIRTVASMLDGVKANWSKMANTSVKGFQRSFIERPGRLEQREEKWVLYVENRAYDILLDSIPWSYRQIRLPWLKKKINVVWRDKEEFDFENL